MSQENLMFRYLINYVGTYVVECHKTLDKHDIPLENGEVDSSYDDLYIPCSVGEIRGCYTPYKLMWYSGESRSTRIGKVNSNVERFKKAGIPCEVDLYDGEGCITFDVDYFDKAAKILHPKKSKSRIGPFGEIIEKPKKKRGRKKKDNGIN